MSEFETIYEVLSLICLILLNVIEIYKYYIEHKLDDDHQPKRKEPLTIQNIQQNQLDPIGTQYNPIPKIKEQGIPTRIPENIPHPISNSSLNDHHQIPTLNSATPYNFIPKPL